MRIVFIHIKVVFFWLYLVSSAYSNSYKIDRSFKLIFWDIEIGVLAVTAEIIDSRYAVSSFGSTKGIISLFSRTLISSGAIGGITASGELIPSESTTRWHSSGKSKQTRLKYSDRKLVYFDHSSKIKKPHHIVNPVGKQNTIDPISLMLWFLIERDESELCAGDLLILDGFRMSELNFLKRIDKPGEIICIGVLRRVSGFKNAEMKKEPIEFEVNYFKDDKKEFFLSEFKIETFFGKITVSGKPYKYGLSM